MVQNKLQKNQLSGSRRIYRYFLQNAGLKSVKSGTFTLIFMQGYSALLSGIPNIIQKRISVCRQMKYIKSPAAVGCRIFSGWRPGFLFSDFIMPCRFFFCLTKKRFRDILLH